MDPFPALPTGTEEISSALDCSAAPHWSKILEDMTAPKLVVSQKTQSETEIHVLPEGKKTA